jgi:hypothetical protein
MRDCTMVDDGNTTMSSVRVRYVVDVVWHPKHGSDSKMGF